MDLASNSTPSQVSSRPILVAVLGNPNTGKSTLFNALTGIRQQTGNYPGVTVEKHTGRLKVGTTEFELVDLPGTYSLAPRSPDEVVTINVLLGRPPATAAPDLILCVLDASNLQRNLFLVSQVLDLNRPTVVAMNMLDVAARNGIEVDLDQLSKLLGVPVVGVQAKRRIGLDKLKQSLTQAVNQNPAVMHDPFSQELKERIERLQAACPDDCQLKRFAVTRMLFDTDGFMTKQLTGELGPELAASVRAEQTSLESAGDSIAESESHARYNWIKQHLGTIVSQSTDAGKISLTDRLDQWLTHPVWGMLLAIGVMVLAFDWVFRIAEPASQMIDFFNGTLSNLVSRFVPPGMFHSLLTDGLINGVGSVLIFLPQILLLFLILAILEDTGYLARAAFLLDKYLARIGLSGLTLFPLLSSFACAIPGIMATRVIKNQRERMITILIAPLMSCSARIPIYTMLIAAFVADERYLFGWIGLRGMTMMLMYVIGIATAIGVAWILKKTLLKTGTSSFVMELPEYKLPSLRNVFQRMFDGGWSFVRDAGTLIVAMTILVWAAGYFPRNEQNLPANLVAQQQTLEQKIEALGDEPDQAIAKPLTEQLTAVEGELAGYRLRQSYLGRAGQLIEPVVKPLGWDWRIGSAAIASFPAREVVVSTMGVIFGLGSEVDEDSVPLRKSLQTATWEGSERKLFTLPVALSLMIFFVLCCQCVSTLAVIRRETNSWRWPVFTFVYMTVLAYVAALVVYQVTSRF